MELKDILKKGATWKASQNTERITADDLLVSETIFEIAGYGYDMAAIRKVNVNCSDILSFLIKEAGRLCDYYASDLFYELIKVDELLYKTEEDFHKRIAFGFREMGVDDNTFMISRLSNPDVYGSPDKIYRALYVLDIDMSHTSDGVPEVKMTLGLVFKGNEERSVTE